MKQTAVEWLIEQLEEKGDAWENASIRKVKISIDVTDYLDLKRQAKAMEKEQIKEAYCMGDDNIGAEQYYNETYGK